jgi:alanine-alpha-ketoisovalerate/valine-pyruvate aminotransferase
MMREGRNGGKLKSGNIIGGGRPKKIPELRELLANVLGDEKDGKSAAEAILMALRNKAIKGDVRAAELLLDRAYGKVKDIDNRPNDLVITISGPTPPPNE